MISVSAIDIELFSFVNVALLVSYFSINGSAAWAAASS